MQNLTAIFAASALAQTPVPPEVFGFRLMLILGAILGISLAAILLLILVIAIKWMRYGKAQRAAEAAFRSERVRPDGQPYPSFSRGLCHDCRQASEKVYSMPDNRRLCPDCYAKELSKS